MLSKEKKQASLVHSKIRHVSWGEQKNAKSERFIYKLFLFLSRYIKKYLLAVKHKAITVYQKCKLLLQNVDTKKVRKDILLWFTETFIEGLTANFATHYLFGVTLNPMTILAHGILIRQGLDICHRFKKDGGTKKLPETD